MDLRILHVGTTLEFATELYYLKVSIITFKLIYLKAFLFQVLFCP